MAVSTSYKRSLVWKWTFIDVVVGVIFTKVVSTLAGPYFYQHITILVESSQSVLIFTQETNAYCKRGRDRAIVGKKKMGWTLTDVVDSV